MDTLDNNEEINSAARAIRIAFLIHKRQENETLSREEDKEMEEWLAQDGHRQLLEHLMDRRQTIAKLKEIDDHGVQDATRVIFDRLGFIKRARYGRITPFQRWGSVAAILLLTVGAIWIFVRKEKPALPVPAVSAANEVIPPGGNRATLTLADGSTIALDSSATRQRGPNQLARQGDANVLAKNGQLIYQSSGTAQAVVYNKITTPRGGQYQVTLQDGTIVWLNAASSLKYPSVFTGKIREVELTGEAYFDVARNIDQPFIVRFQQTHVRVLGTAFNIMAYDDEPAGAQTTLISGRVAVRAGERELTLEPGKMALSGVEELTEKDADIPQAIAWKNGEIALNNADLGNMMRQISRWYDVNVTFKGPMHKRRFGGKIKRSVSLPILLEFLNANGIKSMVNNRDVQLYE